ncbi:MAG: ribbon-helix-helix protein, CopG family [Deltaproteobacteria bacterium]|nr:ribbon-helix-helix protein, CopG family [Deltaproteobacteria bacterium]
MQITVRIPDEIGEKIEALSKRMGLKKSDVVRLALRQLTEEDAPDQERTPFERVRHLVGIGKSGIPDLGSRHRNHLIRKIRGSRP